MQSVYEKCPIYENEKYLLRLVENRDWEDLLKVYSDEKALPFFNSDNCNGDNFYYTSPERMKQAIDFWLMEYGKRYYVRWVIVDKATNVAIGTIELFNRKAEDYVTDCGLLRLDLRSDYEHTDQIESILKLIMNFVFRDFQCNKVATKAVPQATERILALKNAGFQATDENLIGHDGTKYNSYYVVTN